MRFPVFLTEDIFKNLEAGNNCATLLAVTDEGLVFVRAVVGPSVESLAAIVLTDDGVVAAGVTKTKEGIAAGVVVATKEGIFGKGVVVTDNYLVEYEIVAEE